MVERDLLTQPPKLLKESNTPDANDVTIIRTVEEFETIENPEDVKTVHLTNFNLTTVPSLNRLRELCPNLTTARITPSIARMISNVAKQFLEDENIQVQPTYLREPKYLETISDDTQIINNPDKIEKIDEPEKIKKLHLTSQETVTITAINRLIDIFPNLTTVQISPSIILKISQTAQEILTDTNIQTEIGRLDTGLCYDSLPAVNLDEKRQAYNNMLTNPDKGAERQIYFLLKEHGYKAVDMLAMYLGEDNIKIPEIAQRMELSYRFVDKEVRALLHLIGYPSNDKMVLSRSRKLLAQLKNKAEIEAWQKYYQVGEEYPPETLPRMLWPKWQLIMKARQNNPERWTQLKEKKTKNYRAMVYYCQINERRGIKLTISDIGELENVSKQAISGRISSAINYLTKPEKPGVKNRMLEKEIFEDMLTNPEKEWSRNMFEMLNTYVLGFEDVIREYFANIQMSQKEIAEKTGYAHYAVNRYLNMLRYLLGQPEADQQVPEEMAKTFDHVAELKKTTEIAHDNRQAWEQKRQSFSVDDKAPPGSLQSDRWPYWQRIMQTRKDNPERWEGLKKLPMCYQVLIHFFQIDEARGKRIPIDEMLKHTGIPTSYQLYRYKKFALDFLGIRDQG